MNYIYAGDRDTYLDEPRLSEPGNIPGIEPLARALSLINRFCGHTWRPYSVAEHSLLVSSIALSRDDVGRLPEKVQAEIALAALTHDMHEALIGDVSTPVKRILGEPWSEFEEQVEHAVRSAHGLLEIHERWGDVVKVCDLRALATERRDLMDAQTPWSALAGVEPVEGVNQMDPPDPRGAIPVVVARYFADTYSHLKAILNTEDEH
jgi:5'-deoxynucleotidase YfbR-like HD superfamily hydrolase